MKISLILFLILTSNFLAMKNCISQNATDIVKKADDHMRGNTMKAELSIEIVRKDWKREMDIKVWLKEDDYSMILIVSPPKDKGMSFLKRKKEVWNWVPAVERTIKLPPSMMSQSWMGTDFTNDDLVKEASTVNDYNHKILGEESIGDKTCYKIELIPKPGTAIVWGKVIVWIDKIDYLELKSEFYDEQGNLSNTMNGSEIKNIGGRLLPTKFEMIPSDKPDQKTVLKYIDIVFNESIDDDFFTTKNMQSLE